MDGAVEHKAHGAQQRIVEIPHATPRVVSIHAHLVGELLRIERPALTIGSKPHRPAQHRQTAGFEHQRTLQVMSRDTLVIGERGQGPAGNLRHLPQVDVVGAGTRAIERAVLVVPARGADLVGDRHAADLESGLGHGAEVPRQHLGDRLDSTIQVDQKLRAAVVRVGIDEARILVE